MALRQTGGVLSALVATTILLTENYAIASSPVFRRSLFERVAVFDEALQASEDFDLIYRVARQVGLGIMDEVGFLRRFHAGNMSRRTEHVLRYKIASRAKLLRCESDPRLRQRLRGKLIDYHLSLAEYLTRTRSRSHSSAGLRELSGAVQFGHVPRLRAAKCVARYRKKVFLAYHVNGTRLPRKHGAPLRLVYEDVYGSDWVKYVDELEVV